MWEVFRFECRTLLRAPVFVVLAGVFFLFAFLITASEDVNLGGLGNSINLNAAWAIVYTQFFFSLIGMLAAIAVVANAITRDHELGTAELLFATGVNERAFLVGRFAAGTLFAILVGVAALLGTMAGNLMPWLDPERLGPFTLAPYLYALLVVTIPNFVFSSALFFSVAALTRSTIAAFVAGVAFMVFYIVISNLSDPQDIGVYALLDPFGSTAYGEVSRYWTVFERNSELVPLSGSLLWNRLLVLALAALALGFTLWRYAFSLQPPVFRRSRGAKSKVDTPTRATVLDFIPTIELGGWNTLKQLRSQTRMDVRGIYRTIPFWAILGFSALNVWGGFSGTTTAFGNELLPVTSALLRAISGAYLFFIFIIIVYYAGEVVHRERQHGVSLVVDATPYPNWVMVVSKILSLWFVITCLLLFAGIVAVIRQISDGYYNFEPGLYLTSLLFVQGGGFYLLAVLAVFIQVLAGNKWLGMLGLIAAFLMFQAMSSFGYEHDLYNFGTPFAPHSDMNGFGHYWMPVVVFTAYWAVFCVLLAAVAHLLFPRGVETRSRSQAVRQRLTAPVVAMMSVAGLLFAGIGGWIFYNTNVLNEYRSGEDLEVLQVAYEKAYKQYEVQPQPQAVSVDSYVDLYPEERRLESRGSVRLKNMEPDAMAEMFVSVHPFIKVNDLSVAGAQVIEQDPTLGMYRFGFGQALAPDAEVTLDFNLTWQHVGFENSNARSAPGNSANRVVRNGTFVNNTEIMPFTGYNSGLEIGDPNTRREYELPPVQRLPVLDDPDWADITQFGVKAKTSFRTEFTTSATQIAVAPGYQVGPVQEQAGRRKYVYEMDDKIWPFFAFVSAEYEVARDRWQQGEQEVAIEVYHHPAHNANLENMIRATKKSLDYFSAAFSPYQYRQFRILEFPRYASFAQSFPNTIPYSEAIGFVADLRDAEAIDVVFYVTAHEMAHQWWAHQVVGANMQGMTAIVETLAQYSALMVMEQEYGRARMRRFLRYELDNYLQSRGGEVIEELPLMLTENQQYIHYQKGSLVMYALQDAIGEEAVNAALAKFIVDWSEPEGRFATAKDMVDGFRAVAPDSAQALITDLFEKITLYDLRVSEVSATPVADDAEQYTVDLNIEAAKRYADGEGRESDAPLDVWVEVAVFPQAGDDLEDYELPEPLYLERKRLTGDTQLSLVVQGEPARVAVDPYHILIDRNPEDNFRQVR